MRVNVIAPLAFVTSAAMLELDVAFPSDAVTLKSCIAKAFVVDVIFSGMLPLPRCTLLPTYAHVLQLKPP